MVNGKWLMDGRREEPLTLILCDRGTTRSLLADSVPPSESGRGEGVPPGYVKLPNKANFSECWTMWISLRDNVLEVQVCHFVTWLCFAKIGFVLGVRPRL